MKQETIGWSQVECGKIYELQSVTSTDPRTQTRIGEPFVRLVEHDRRAFTSNGLFATVEPETSDNAEHVKVRHCANYIVLREVTGY